MNKKKILGFIMLILGASHFSLYSLITSRVQGRIVDRETGELIEGAEVALLELYSQGDDGLSFDLIGYKKSDDKGHFRFDGIKKESKYFFAVFKDGYANVGPFNNKERYKRCRSDIWGGGCFLNNDLKKYAVDMGSTRSEVEVPAFLLRQGQIKSVDVPLDEEAGLEIRVYQKTLNGKELMSNIGKIYIYHSKYPEVEIINTNPFSTKYKKAGLVTIECYSPGYPAEVYRNVPIKKGRTITIERVLDFSEGQVLHGFIWDKNTGNPMSSLSLYLFRVDPSSSRIPIEEVFTDCNGEFRFGGFEPGKYVLETGYYYSGCRKIEHKEILEFQASEKKEIVREF